MSNFKFKIIIAVISLLFLSEIQGNGLNQNSEIYKQSLDQADEIDLILELLTEAMNKGKLSQKNKKESLKKLANMRTIINDFKDTTSQNPAQIIGINEIMLSGLQVMTTNNFKAIPDINNNLIVRRTKNPISTSEAQAKLELNTNKLNNIQRSFKHFGLSAINIVARSADKIITKFSVDKILSRLTPYALILVYMIWITRQDELNQITSYLPEPIVKLINLIKKLIGTPFYVKQEVSTDKNQDRKVDDYHQFEDGAIPNPNKLNFGNLLKIEIEPILKWAPAATLLAMTGKDWTDSIKYLKKKFNFLYSRLKNEKFEDDNIFGKPTLSHDSLDLSAIPEFKAIINYFKYKHLFDLADHSIDKSYILVGHQLTSYLMADILCAKLAKELENDCRIVQLNASDFLAKKASESDSEEDKLKVTLNNSKKYDVNIIVIKDLDWIYKQKGQAVAKLDKFLSDLESKNNTILIALTNKIDEVGDNSKNKLSRFDINNLNEDQRSRFIKSQLRPDHAEQDMDLETISKQTENCNLAELKRMVKNAYTLSFTEHKPFSKKHLEQSVEDMLAKKNQIKSL